MTAETRRGRPRSTHGLTRQIGACPVPVDIMDWPKVSAGVKTEFRHYLSRPLVVCPRPVILHSPHPHLAEMRSQVVILEENWREPIGAISPESLAREDFADLSEFRRYVTARWPKLGFRTLKQVQVYRFRLLAADELDEWGRWALVRLYGEALP